MSWFSEIFTKTTFLVIYMLLSIHTSNSFSSSSSSVTSIRHSLLGNQEQNRHSPLYLNRRSFFHTSATSIFGGVIATSVVSPNDIANALPMVTVYEFEQILKDSAKSVSGVALSGPKLETAVVTLIDGTQFGISDIYESPTDPRSPLRLIATCRSYNVPTKSVALEEAVLSLSSSGSKKKRVYMNERVRVAAEKEREKKLRLEQDELERQAELERMGQN